jgi:hypothetical protein
MPSDESLSPDPLDVSQMSREQRDALQRRILSSPSILTSSTS